MEMASTGPRCFQRGMEGDRGAAVQPCVASTGPRCFQRGMALAFAGVVGQHHGFNGAALFPTRNAGLGRQCLHHPARFNGAALFPTRNGARGSQSQQGICVCFNGAALFPTRNDKIMKARALVKASTGPRCFQRGMTRNVAGGTCMPGFNGAALFPTRNVSTDRGSNPDKEGFNGAALFPTRNGGRSCRRRLCNSRLQRGRVVSNAECRRVFGASTGPRCFQRGMPLALKLPPSTAATLQRGRVVSNAE